MYQQRIMYKSERRWHKSAYLAGILCLVLLALGSTFSSTAYASTLTAPGGNITDPVVKAVDIAEPADVRILTQLAGQLSVTLGGKAVTFPTTPQNGVDGYVLDLLGSGAFISGKGDLLTADHVVNPPTADLDYYT